MPERTFDVVRPTGGHRAGSKVTEKHLRGLNIYELILDGHLIETTGAPAPEPSPSSPAEESTGD